MARSTARSLRCWACGSAACLLEQDGLAVRRAPGRLFPLVAALLEKSVRQEALARDDALEGREPMPVVFAAVVDVPSAADLGDDLRKASGPFLPGERASLVQRHRHGERLGFPRRLEHRPFGIARDARHLAVDRVEVGLHWRYGSQRSTYTAEAVVCSPHRSRASKRTP